MELLLLILILLVANFATRKYWPEDPVKPGTYDFFKKPNVPRQNGKRSNRTTLQRFMYRRRR